MEAISTSIITPQYINRNLSIEFVNKSVNITFCINIIIVCVLFVLFRKSNIGVKHLTLKPLENIEELHNRNLLGTYSPPVNNIPNGEFFSIDADFEDLDLPYEVKRKRFIIRLITHSYSGRWTSKDKFFDFDNKEGLFRVFFQNYIMRGPKGNLYNCIFFIHDGEKKDRWLFIENTFPMNYNDNSTSIKFDNETVLQNPSLQMGVTELETFDLIYKKIGTISLEMNYRKIPENGFDNSTYSNYLVNRGLVHVINGSIAGHEALRGLDLNFEVVTEKISFYHKISNFSMVLTILAALQMLNSKTLMEKFALNEAEALKFAPNVFVINIIWNGFICFTNFVISLYDDRMFNNFVAPTVIYFLNFSYFELRAIFHIWRAQIFVGDSSGSQDYSAQSTAFKNKLMRFYIFLYLAMFFIYLYGAQIFFWKSFLYTMASVTWLPQIWLNFKKGRRNVIPFTTVFIISLNKIYVPLYFRFCPKNFFDIGQDLTFCIILSGIILFQILVLFLQKIFGMRCLLPKCMLPQQFDYGKTLKELNKLNLELENMTCSICLGSFVIKEDRSSVLDVNPDAQSNKDISVNKTDNDIRVVTSIEHNENRILRRMSRFKFSSLKSSCSKYCDELIKKCNRENLNSTNFMLTPCKHLFHTECLKAWIEVKNQCPECRSNLPMERELNSV